LLGGLMTTATSAPAQELQLTGPLRSAPAGFLLWRERRFALSPLAGAATGDGGPNALLGAETLFYPVNELGLGAWSVVALAPPSAPKAAGVTGTLVAPEIVLVPIEARGARLFDSIWLPPFDVHLNVGAAWIAPAGAGVDPVRPAVGAGFTSFFASFMSFGVDYRVVGDTNWRVLTASLTYWAGERRWSDED
jgi:hypothetical protein